MSSAFKRIFQGLVTLKVHRPSRIERQGFVGKLKCLVPNATLLEPPQGGKSGLYCCPQFTPA